MLVEVLGVTLGVKLGVSLGVLLGVILGVELGSILGVTDGVVLGVDVDGVKIISSSYTVTFTIFDAKFLTRYSTKSLLLSCSTLSIIVNNRSSSPTLPTIDTTTSVDWSDCKSRLSFVRMISFVSNRRCVSHTFTDLPFFVNIEFKNDTNALAIESIFSNILLSFVVVSIAILILAD